MVALYNSENVKTCMEGGTFSSATLLKVTLNTPPWNFHVLYIVQMVGNRAKHHNWLKMFEKMMVNPFHATDLLYIPRKHQVFLYFQGYGKVGLVSVGWKCWV